MVAALARRGPAAVWLAYVRDRRRWPPLVAATAALVAAVAAAGARAGAAARPGRRSRSSTSARARRRCSRRPAAPRCSSTRARRRWPATLRAPRRAAHRPARALPRPRRPRRRAGGRRGPRARSRTALLPRPPAAVRGARRLAARLAAAGDRGAPRATAPVTLAGAGWACACCPRRPPGGESGNQSENDCALVVLAELGGQRVLVPGDAEGEVLAGARPAPVRRRRAAAPRQPRRPRRGAARRARAAALAVISVGPTRTVTPRAEMLDLLAARRRAVRAHRPARRHHRDGCGARSRGQSRPRRVARPRGGASGRRLRSRAARSARRRPPGRRRSRRCRRDRRLPVRGLAADDGLRRPA